MIYTDRPETRVPMERRRAIGEALAAIVAGDREHAVEVLVDSVHRQSRWSAGIAREQAVA